MSGKEPNEFDDRFSVDFAEEPEQDDPYSDLNLKFKLVQPDSNLLKKLASRNYALGWVNEAEYQNSSRLAALGLRYVKFPYNNGGWLTKEFAIPIFQSIELNFVMSNSVNGNLRKHLNTQKVVSVNEDIQRGSSSGFMKRFSREELN